MGRIVRLHDGTHADSDSPEWRHECEARAILALQGTQVRRLWLADIELRRGKEEADRLRRTMLAIRDAEQRQ